MIAPLAYSIREACHQLGDISRSSLYRHIKAGRLQVSKVGSRSLITHSQIVRLLDDGMGDNDAKS